MNRLLASVAVGAIITKAAPEYVTKDGPVRRGDSIELKLNFTAASDEEVRKALGGDAPDGYVAGWASTSGRDYYNHEVVAGAFQEAIDKRTLTGPAGIKLLLDHNWEKPAGVIKVLEYRRGKLWMEAQMNLDVGYAKERWSMLKMMGGANFSVGFMLQDYEVITRQVDGDDESYLRIDRGDLFEVSIVLFPGNEEAQMLFVKAAFHEDNPSNDELIFAKAKNPSWRMGVSKNLPTTDMAEFDSVGAKARLFKAAGMDGESPNFEMLRKAFLVYDAANPTLKSAYRLPIADVIGGKVVACSAAVALASSRIATTDIPDTVKLDAHAAVEAYETQFVELAASTKAAPKTLSEFEKALVASGLCKGRNEARAIAQVAKTCPQVFQKQEEVIHERVDLSNDKLTEMLSSIMKAKSILTSTN